MSMAIHKSGSGSVYRRGFKLGVQQDPGLKAPYVCGYHTGAGKNELRRIPWEQVDFSGSVIRLPASQTKTKKARTLPIYGDMRRWLERQRATCPPSSVWVFHGAITSTDGRQHASGQAFRNSYSTICAVARCAT